MKPKKPNLLQSLPYALYQELGDRVDYMTKTKRPPTKNSAQGENPKKRSINEFYHDITALP